MVNRLTEEPLFLRKMSHNKVVTINGRWIKNRIIADFEGALITVVTLEDLFHRYGNDNRTNGMSVFLNGEFQYRAPNADITPFHYDPFTGEKIDWDEIKSVYNV